MSTTVDLRRFVVWYTGFESIQQGGCMLIYGNRKRRGVLSIHVQQDSMDK